jgi:6-phosphogluconate dehydrogenase
MTDCSARLAGINVGAPVRLLASGDFGLIGLAVMGQNLILNIADHGFTVIAYNRTVSKVDRFLANEAKGAGIPSPLPSCSLGTDGVHQENRLSVPIR